MPPSARCRCANFFSIVSCRFNNQSIASYRSSSSTPSRFSIDGKVVISHHLVLASLLFFSLSGSRIRPTTIATTRSRSLHRRALIRRSKPSRLIVRCTASTCPWCQESTFSKSSSMERNLSPLSERRRRSMLYLGKREIFERVLVLTFPSSR